jgi:acetoacetyl-CoA synthetase
MSEIWRPSPERIQAAQLTRFMHEVSARRGRALTTHAEVYAWSIERPEEFWVELARFAGVRAEWGNGPVLENPTAMPGARFFPGATLNFAENLLYGVAGPQEGLDERPALIFRSEHGVQRQLSYGQLRREVARVAAGLRACGVIAGDRVAGYLPNLPEAVIGMLASASLGAIWSSCSPDFGAPAVVERFGQIAPKVLFAADGYCYGGKLPDCIPRVAEVAQQLGVEQVVVVPYIQARPPLDSLGTRACLWEDFGTPDASSSFASLPFNHPLYILFSSGTTGKPKCIVHGAGGTLLQHLKEHLLHTDLHSGDRLFYFTTCSWMMWNWLVSALACGTTVVLYDGSPFHPKRVLWLMAEDLEVTHFGTSAKYLAALQKHEVQPAKETDLRALRAVLSTGSPLAPAGFDYVYESVKGDVQLASISGGTDIVSCFALGSPILPVHRGELQCRGLGMRVEIVDAQGLALRGERGELVCTAPFPSMPIGFWNDPDGRRYRAAYFERFPGIWHHGDFATLTEHDGLIIHGRSDAVLNPGGVRIGTAELYSAVESLPEVTEALAVGQDWNDDVRVVLFVRLAEGLTLDEPLRQKIRDTIRAYTTPRHVPARIIAVPDLPRTRSGKLSEIAVRQIIHGLPVTNLESLVDPAVLDAFRDLPELAS